MSTNIRVCREPQGHLFQVNSRPINLLGTRACFHFGANLQYRCEAVYVEAGAALTRGKIYYLPHGHQGGTPYTPTTLVTHANSILIGEQNSRYPCCVPQIDIPSGSFGWVAVQGDMDVFVDSSSATAQRLYTSDANAGNAAEPDISGASGEYEHLVCTVPSVASPTLVKCFSIDNLKVARISG